MKKRPIWEVVVIALVGAGTLGILVGVYFVAAGVSARPQPGALETFIARTVRNLAIAWHAGHRANPVPNTEEVLAQGRAHFADHCASCHANDGSGDTEMGRGLYPRSPDLRLAATQNLEDHELFYIIENGIRLTGMPAWGTGKQADEEDSWHLVRFIRHLPRITPEEIEQMQSLNPESPEKIRQQIEEEKFLGGGSEKPKPPTSTQQR